MEDKDINNYTLGEKIGFIMAKIDSIDKKIDKSIDESCKRICDCEIKIDEHSKVIATAKGKVSIIGSVWGSISALLTSLLIWYLTK
jgi:hypothetical protein